MVVGSFQPKMTSVQRLRTTNVSGRLVQQSRNFRLICILLSNDFLLGVSRLVFTDLLYFALTRITTKLRSSLFRTKRFANPQASVSLDMVGKLSVLEGAIRMTSVEPLPISWTL